MVSLSGGGHVDDAVLAISDRKNNAELIADVAKLGYLDGHVLDMTYGYGTFWKEWQPEEFTYHDAKLDGVDFRDLPYEDGTFDAVVFDGPYKLNGTPDPTVDERYGVDKKGSIESRHQLLMDGVEEGARVCKTKGYLLVKCQDQVASGRVWWQTDMLTTQARMVGCVKVDSILFPSYRKQPAGTRQVHFRRNYSTLLVFRKEV